MAKGNIIGGWAFLIAFIIAIVLGAFGLVEQYTALAIILVFVGIIAGLLNIADKEATPFLMSGVILVIVASLGQEAIPSILNWMNLSLSALLNIFVPATLIVAIRNVFSLARS